MARVERVDEGIVGGRMAVIGVCQFRQVPMKSKKMALMAGLRGGRGCEVAVGVDMVMRR